EAALRVDHDAENQAWDLAWDDLRYRLRLQAGMLVCESFGPADRFAPPTDWPPPDPIQITRTEGRVGLALADRAVHWSLLDWARPEPHLFALTLEGTDAPIRTELRFRLDSASGLLLRETTLRHTSAGAEVAISSAQSVSLLLPTDVDEVIHLAGRLVAETQVQRQRLTETPIYLESRAGKTGYRFSPYLALTSPTHTYLCELFWSGNWQMHVERLFDGRVQVSAGLNPWGLRHHLRPGDELALPTAVIGCVPGDLNAATHRLHDLRRRRRPNPDRPVPVHFNTWYPATEHIPVDRAKEFVPQAAALGCESLVLDAGWFRKELPVEGDGWWRKTGDWIVDEHLYPNGLEELSDACRDHGLGFGIWFEPEAVGVNAWVRRNHPEWLHALGGRETPSDERAILHLGVPEARAFIRDRILDILGRTGAVWMKWDFNTDLNQGGWAPGLPNHLTAHDPLIAHYQGLYQLQDDIRAALPDLTLEMCAGGGSRMDGALLSHAHVNWMSDQTQALVNLAIHFGSHLAHPAIECNNWLVEWPPHDALHRRQWTDDRGDLAFRTRVAMLGTFGISAPLDRWSSDDLAVVRRHVDWYKRHVQPLLQTGDEYFLTDPPPLDGNGDWAAIWYAAKDADRGALFAFRLGRGGAEQSFALPGLDPAATYRVTPFDGAAEQQTGKELFAGLTIAAAEPYRSVLIAAERT
ncbi:MAG: alpha-galactosidase, partial [Thermomicrobiales bacterium]|nr:alpha-galactosidase [Thermomicrobiales bacterium]